MLLRLSFPTKKNFISSPISAYRRKVEQEFRSVKSRLSDVSENLRCTSFSLHFSRYFVGRHSVNTLPTFDAESTFTEGRVMGKSVGHSEEV